VAVFAYEPLSQILPRAAALVHHGGIGTIALALRAACPQLIMPLANDQPDNAARIARHSVARLIAPSRYQEKFVATELMTLVEDQTIKRRCGMLQKIIADENGARAAAGEIEKVATDEHR
jgi:UDP:flavonoid glycosyltransferase YjiC (YdhE family)